MTNIAKKCKSLITIIQDLLIEINRSLQFLDCYFNGRNIIGNDIAFFSGQANVSDCQSFCQLNLNCMSFTFHNNGSCWLKSSTDDFERHEEYTSGPKKCNSSRQIISTNPVLKRGITTDAECQRQCRQTVTCKSFYFERVTVTYGNCYFYL
jgi:hypothetical protein